MITKQYGQDFKSWGGALTLRPEHVTDQLRVTGTFEKTHESGWTIKGEIVEDYYYWINDFEASHPELGIVSGDFEKKVVASSEEAFLHFWKHHEPEAWDYMDI